MLDFTSGWIACESEARKHVSSISCFPVLVKIACDRSFTNGKTAAGTKLAVNALFPKQDLSVIRVKWNASCLSSCQRFSWISCSSILIQQAIGICSHQKSPDFFCPYQACWEVLTVLHLWCLIWFTFGKGDLKKSGPSAQEKKCSNSWLNSVICKTCRQKWMYKSKLLFLCISIISTEYYLHVCTLNKWSFSPDILKSKYV